MDDEAPTLGQLIRALREARQWSQADLAALVGTTARTIGNWERDEAKPRNRMGALEEAFGMKLTSSSLGIPEQQGLTTNTRETDPVVRAIEGSHLNRANQHKLIGTYYELLDQQREGAMGA